MLPLKTQRACWFADRNFTTLVRSAPEIPRLNVKVALDDGSTAIMPLKAINAADVELDLE